ncbi:MAG TPA: hypothetical protein VFK02_06140 [Kofleriaceae bacterium]|nr:hypothetical protein [Kofleriaceae bacterium]
MLRWIPALVLGGCGFQARAVGDDSPAMQPDDAAMAGIDGDAPAMPAGDCWSKWLTAGGGSLAFSTIRPLLHQSDTNASERDPWVSRDGKRLYYAYDPSGAAGSQIYLASRTTSEDEFGTGDAIPNVSDPNLVQDGVSLTEDELILILASNRATATASDFYLSTRGAMNDTFPNGDDRFLQTVNNLGAQAYDPSLTADGLRLYFSAPLSGGTQHILLSTRLALTDSFGTPQPVPVINDATKADADPAVSRDERVIVFSSFRPTGIPMTGASNLWYATRQDPGASFGPPRPIPGVNSDKDDGDPRLSDDGCTLYFSSNRDGTTRDLFRAVVAP